MAVITIHCRLISSKSNRHQLWNLMVQKNTPLINELLLELSQHEDLEQWCELGKLPSGLISKLCDQLKQRAEFEGQPSRFYASAINLVDYIYKSYLRTQRRLRFRLQGQQRWFEMFKSDTEFKNETNFSLTDIRVKARELLDKDLKDSSPDDYFKTYESTSDLLTRSAISYLLKNGRKLPEKPEDYQKFQKRRRKLQIKIEKLQKKIDSSPPMGRNLTNDSWLGMLNLVSNTIPQTDEEAKQWQDQLLRQSKSVPYPVMFNTNEDLRWSKNKKGRLCVTFNGLGKLVFEIYCDQQQLKWFERFYEDQEVKRKGKNQHSSALFTLRSGMLLWQEHEGKQEAWQNNHLTLYCSLDTCFETAEGTELVRQKKVKEVVNLIDAMNNKSERTKTQDAFIKRKQSTLARLDNSFPRPSKPLYQGNQNIVVAVSMSLEYPATIAMFNMSSQEVLTYRSTKQLLDNNYHLLNRQRNQKQRLSHQRHKTQRQNSSDFFTQQESELGQYLDRLLAQSIVSIAKQYQASTILLPNLKNIRDSIQAEIEAKAEAKIPNCKEAQKKYLKNYRINIHHWSYGRLIDSIQLQASKLDILIQEVKQPIRGSPQEKAKQMAILTLE
ncbi:hypothetical protein GM3708_786 [Geminocystis sp. NIES-3708]|uniref:type V CRISPR-associated protein Cas12k n=1 Tax=Geminocystis sp. NIES-3708 TaxID=1615909 RepID=UPI0005FCAE4C|nr:type V CRISPR-associated protein Cas12k [Geminocystis sp. NIES-3708]BAQ60380.1 hypothetical protein GM3708_786 [Geminocystis sp. NIES-3708]